MHRVGMGLAWGTQGAHEGARGGAGRAGKGGGGGGGGGGGLGHGLGGAGALNTEVASGGHRAAGHRG